MLMTESNKYPEIKGAIMSTVTIEEAQAKLPELIAQLTLGEEVIITCNQQPVAQLIPLPSTKPQPVFGSCKGKLTIVSEDKVIVSSPVPTAQP
jgi:antitoxin (DNA-binding transcriptional repressor) of toxin-antitoxin stability system